MTPDVIKREISHWLMRRIKARWPDGRVGEADLRAFVDALCAEKGTPGAIRVYHNRVSKRASFAVVPEKALLLLFKIMEEPLEEAA